ncbi:hypothetical protein Clacol_008554 [Clathrus columnatus]|uniref:Chromate ion transporter n=1 Tax=Clathrus columnatus TaxID=1419009 RepID=A0AAV5AQZ1_9AGAM|nr:hypothetical protein Clacol_008554 [Clathrus columnatus]
MAAVVHQVAAPRKSLAARCIEVLRFYGPLGFVAFGGPSANIVLLRKIFVRDEKWLDDKTFTDLLALSSALPGPAFSQYDGMLFSDLVQPQLAFSISLLRGGMIPGLLSFVLLTGPGALAMFGFGFGVKHISNTLPDIVFALFSGLNAAAVGLIALAAYNLSQKVITDPITRIEVFLSAAFATCFDSQWLYPVLVAAGGLATLVWDWTTPFRSKIKARAGTVMKNKRDENRVVEDNRDVEQGKEKGEPSSIPDVNSPEIINIAAPSGPTSPQPDFIDVKTPMESVAADEKDETVATEHQLSPYFTLGSWGGFFITVAYILFLVLVIILRATVTRTRAFDFFVRIMIAGTIIFGGGPVVIPLLRSYVVDPGWVSSRNFILGFALIQALPGPQFNFAIYLGVLAIPHQPVVGAILGCVAIFTPGIVLKIGLLPFYNKWRDNDTAKSVLRGLNAAAVGLIYAATYRLLQVGFIMSSGEPDTPAIGSSLFQDGWWVVVTAGAFVGCEWFKVPSPIAILGGGVAGVAWWGVTKR